MTEKCENMFIQNSYQNTRKFCNDCLQIKRNSRALALYHKNKEAAKLAWLPDSLKHLPDMEVQIGR